jgi:hypothetical protein
LLNPGLHTLSVDERGETALALLPAPSGPREAVYIYAAGLLAADAWTGTAFRTSVEYHCVNLGNSMTLDPPTDDRAFDTLCDMLGPLPGNLHLGRSASGTHRGLALLPALRLNDEADLDAAAATVNYRASAYGDPVARTVATALAVFADNSMTHAGTSSVGVVTTIAFEPAANSMHVVSTDLGPDLVEPGNAEEYLLSLRAHARAAHSNLAHLVEASSRRGLSAVLTLASGPGRLRWSADGVNSTTTFAAPGFTQALTINNIR